MLSDVEKRNNLMLTPLTPVATLPLLLSDRNNTMVTAVRFE